MESFSFVSLPLSIVVVAAVRLSIRTQLQSLTLHTGIIAYTEYGIYTKTPSVYINTRVGVNLRPEDDVSQSASENKSIIDGAFTRIPSRHLVVTWAS